jgi:hypothetical protein
MFRIKVDRMESIMRRTHGRILFELCLLLPLVGCVYSDEGLGPADGSDTVFDATLIGDWVATDSRTRVESPTFTRIERQANSKSEYTITGYGAEPQTT